MIFRIVSTATLFLVLMIVLDPDALNIVSGVWNFAFLTCSLGVAVILFNRFWLSALVVTSGYGFSVAADRAKFYFMDDHLRWSDLTNITKHFDNFDGLRQFVLLMGTYVAGAVNWITLTIILTIAALVYAFFRLENPVFTETSSLAPPYRRLGSAALLMFMLLASAPYSANTVFYRMQADRLIASNYDVAGMPMFFFASKNNQPRGKTYSDQERVAAYSMFHALDQKRGSVSSVKTHPDIILWLNESTFDPTDFENAHVASGPWQKPENMPQFSIFKPDASTVKYGALDVGIFGGKSWNTVFALQAGSHVAWFDDDTYAASTLAQRVDNTLYRTLKTAGYQTTALYAQDGYLFDAAQSQRSYGADFFYGSNYLKSKDKRFGYTTDTELANFLLTTLAKPHDGPRAFFIFTMANHGPYPSNDFKTNADMSVQWGNLPIGALDYMTRLSATNRTMQKLSKAVDTREQPTIFVQLGDHKPRIPDITFSADNKYRTYYKIQTNFGPPKSVARGRYDTDIMFIGSTVLELAGIRGGHLFRANRTLATECHVKFTPCSDGGNVLMKSYRILASENLRL